MREAEDDFGEPEPCGFDVSRIIAEVSGDTLPSVLESLNDLQRFGSVGRVAWLSGGLVFSVPIAERRNRVDDLRVERWFGDDRSVCPTVQRIAVACVERERDAPLR